MRISEILCMPIKLLALDGSRTVTSYRTDVLKDYLYNFVYLPNQGNSKSLYQHSYSDRISWILSAAFFCSGFFTQTVQFAESSSAS